MPTCPTTPPPPALALALPWEAPLNYAAILALAILLGIIVRSLYTKAAKPLTPRMRIGFLLLVVGALGVVGGISGIAVVFLPSTHQIVAWINGQTATLNGQACSLDGQSALVDRLLGVGVTWGRVMGIVVTCGLAMTSVGGILYRHALRRRALSSAIPPRTLA